MEGEGRRGWGHHVLHACQAGHYALGSLCINACDLCINVRLQRYGVFREWTGTTVEVLQGSGLWLILRKGIPTGVVCFEVVLCKHCAVNK